MSLSRLKRSRSISSRPAAAAVALDPAGQLGQVLVEAEPIAEAGQGVEAGDRLELFVEAQQFGLLDDQRLLLHEQELVLAPQVELVLLHPAVEASDRQELAVRLAPPSQLDLVGDQADDRSERGGRRARPMGRAGSRA